jgi:hypothetical protein
MHGFHAQAKSPHICNATCAAAACSPTTCNATCCCICHSTTAQPLPPLLQRAHQHKLQPPAPLAAPLPLLLPSVYTSQPPSQCKDPMQPLQPHRSCHTSKCITLHAPALNTSGHCSPLHQQVLRQQHNRPNYCPHLASVLAAAAAANACNPHAASLLM